MRWRVLLIPLASILFTGCFLHVGSYRDSDGSLVYVGEVVNTGAPLSYAWVEGTFYDAAGNVIGTHRGDVCQVLPANGIAAFEVRLPPGTPDPARVEWRLLGDEVADAYLAGGLSAEITNTVVRGDITHVFGNLRNNSANTYTRGYVCAAWVNADGTLLRMAQTTAAGLLNAPGSSLPFQFSAQVPPDAVGLNFYLDAGVTPPEFPRTRVVSLPVSAFRHPSELIEIDVPGGGVLVSRSGEVHNTGSEPIYPEVFATLHDAAGALVGVDFAFDICDVTAAPGGFTYRGFSMSSPASAADPPDVTLEAVVLDDDAVVALDPTSIEFPDTPGTMIRAVTGTVRNTSGRTLDHVRVCAGLYDAGGNLLGYGSDEPAVPAGGLRPNASVSFSADVLAPGDVESAKAVADGVPAE
jgi:hypothetical protein